MSWLKSFRGRVRQVLGVRMPPSFGPGVGSYGNLSSYGYSFSLPGSSLNYQSEVGDPTTNSVVSAITARVISAFLEAPCVIKKRNGHEWVILDDHPAYDLINGRNSVMTYAMIMSGVIMGRLAWGNSFMHIAFRNGEPYALTYLPSQFTKVEAPQNGEVFISSYIFQPPNSPPQRFHPDQIVHIRNGVDPGNPRYGFNPITGVAREISTDNEAATAAAALIRNMPFPSYLYAPDTEVEEMSVEKMRRFKDQFERQFQADNRGGILIPNMPGNLQSLHRSPSELSFDEVRRVPAERICAAFGVSPIWIGVGSGIERATHTNLAEARRMSYHSCIIPLWAEIASQMSDQILPWYEADFQDYKIDFDFSKVIALQEDVNLLHERMREDYMGGILNLNESRANVGLPPAPHGDAFLVSTASYNSSRDALLGGKQPKQSGEPSAKQPDS